MSRVVIQPPESKLLADGAKVGGWWHDADEPGRIVCDLCPRACSLKPGDRGFCFVRENRDGQMVLTTYGRSTGFCIDPIEKKPLNHFYPGTSILSFGTAGCNLGCKFCQNWESSKSREVSRLSEHATPETIAAAAAELGCHSVAYTYNDPVIFAEYAIDVAKACRAVGIKSVAVTAGYIMPAAREALFQQMDAANVDLKALTERFYHKLSYAHLQPVLDTLAWLKRDTGVWFEITNLVIPDENDSVEELNNMCDWVLEAVGDEVPLHFSAFHPDFRMRDKPRTPLETLLAAREIALGRGVKYVYVGNVDDVTNQSTYCPHCGRLLIERNWYELGVYNLSGDRCGHCDGRIAGRFEQTPGNWGSKRRPVRIAQFARPQQQSPGADDKENDMATETQSGGTGDARKVPHSPRLSEQQESAIHRAACEVVSAGVMGVKPSLTDQTLAGCAEQTVMGAFVTLKRKGKLRACCGMLGQPVPVAEAVEYAAMRTATEDTRFPTISPTELEHLHVDVTLLFGFQPIKAKGEDRVKEVEVGRHGLQIQRGGSSGLLLPSVPIEHGWDAETFLQQVCRKAGLPTTSWLADDAQLLKFEGHMIPADFDPTALGGNDGEQPPMFTDAELSRLRDHCFNNIAAFAQGATPNYYLPDCPDGTVVVAALTVRLAEDQEPLVLSQMSLRPGIPLQATLVKLAEAAATAGRRQGLGRDAIERIHVGLTVLYDPAMHGTAAQADLAGVDAGRRAILVFEGDRSAWAFDPAKSAEQLLDQASRDARVANPESASVFSLAALSSEAAVRLSNVPRTRHTAAAGSYYPANAGELSKMVDGMLTDGDVTPQEWPAVMVPHAGLIYSGRLAAATLKRVILPETVILIGPRHWPIGRDFAVMPYESWSLPGCEMRADPEMAQLLADRIPGLELDSVAHQKEHCLEVQLPFLARLAPKTRVVGIVVARCELEQCFSFAADLADALREMEKKPLLIVSSDMNHGANDDETRRLDEIALSAVETLDPASLYETVVARHNISMCGVLPAVIVMETLRKLNLLKKCERVGYATSAEVTGDKSSAVGYAGMLFG